MTQQAVSHLCALDSTALPRDAGALPILSQAAEG